MTKPMTMDSVTESLAAGRPLEAAAKYYLLHSGNVSFEAALAHVESISSRVKTWKNNPWHVQEEYILSRPVAENIMRRMYEYGDGGLGLFMALNMEGITINKCNECMDKVRSELTRIDHHIINSGLSLGILNEHVAEMIRNYTTPKENIYSIYVSNEVIDRIMHELDNGLYISAASILRGVLYTNSGRIFTHEICNQYMKDAWQEMSKFTGTPVDHIKRISLSNYITKMIRNHVTPDVVQKGHIYSEYLTDERIDRIIGLLDVDDSRFAAVVLRAGLAANEKIRFPDYGITCEYMKEAHKEISKITGTPNFVKHTKRLRLSAYISELVRNHSTT